jgi:hypothetical protein
MASALKKWRIERRQADYWDKARRRSETMREAELIGNVDLALMTAGQAITRYRSTVDRDSQLDQLLELKMNLEAALGMLDNVLMY